MRSEKDIMHVNDHFYTYKGLLHANSKMCKSFCAPRKKHLVFVSLAAGNSILELIMSCYVLIKRSVWSQRRVL